MRRSGLTGFACVVCVAALVLVAPVIFPAPAGILAPPSPLAPDSAFAAQVNYTVDELTCDLQVETNGSANVVERQVVTFNGKSTGYVWYLHAPEEGESVKVNSMRAAPVDNGGTLLDGWTKLQMIDSSPSRQGRDPGDSAAPSLRTAGVQPWYSYNISDGMVRCYFPAESGSWLIEADYTVLNRVRVYRDVGELYWRYAHSSLPAGASDITLQVALPVPADTPVAPGENVIAWGHGPNGGSFVIGEDGSIVYHLDSIKSGEYAEAHVLFPASWISNLPANASHAYSELRRQAAIAEEAEWVDSGLRGTNWDNMVRVLFLAIAAAVILIGGAAAIRLGRSPRARQALVRTSCTLAIVALGEQLFFREPFTTVFLLATALVVAGAALSLPGEPVAQNDQPVSTDTAKG